MPLRPYDYRVFRLSRMRDLELLPERFTRRDASYRDYFDADDTTPAGTSPAPLVDLHLRFTPQTRFLVEDHFDETERIVRDDESGALNPEPQVQAGIAEWLRSFAPPAGEEAFAERAKHYMRSMPAWADRPS